ncbi:MAG: hypothetical protein ACHBN1_21760 [Heteroscytonema crispum UTEX LB 1556]
MTENKALIEDAQSEQLADSSTGDIFQKQVVDRRAFLRLPVAQQAATVAEYFVPGSEEME